MTKKIPLTQGKFALVDKEDYEFLNQFKWNYALGYARRNKRLPNGKRKMIFMHRVIMGTHEDMVTDHINGDTLDNRKSNLRICTRGQNQMNVGKVRDGSSKYKGVSWYKTKRHKTGKWVARINADNKAIRLGYFQTEKEAAIAYNNAALMYHGEFANLNEVKDEMDFTEYQIEAKRTIPENKWFNTNISNFCMGLAGESGEVIDYLKKVIYHDHDLDAEKLKDELGDLLWYVSAIATIAGINLEDVALHNIDKLKSRYPNGFNAQDSINRKEA